MSIPHCHRQPLHPATPIKQTSRLLLCHVMAKAWELTVARKQRWCGQGLRREIPVHVLLRGRLGIPPSAHHWLFHVLN
jgi:hypothetical protein